jgi:hypothetical protein
LQLGQTSLQKLVTLTITTNQMIISLAVARSATGKTHLALYRTPGQKNSLTKIRESVRSVRRDYPTSLFNLFGSLEGSVRKFMWGFPENHCVNELQL